MGESAGMFVSTSIFGQAGNYGGVPAMEHRTAINVTGPKIRQLRETLGMTQDQLAARCQVLGLDLTRGTLAKIETQIRAVSDHELPFIARALKTSIDALFSHRPVKLLRKARNPKGTKRQGK